MTVTAQNARYLSGWCRPGAADWSHPRCTRSNCPCDCHLACPTCGAPKEKP